MGRIEEFKKLVKDILLQYASEASLSYGDVEIETVLDDERGHYELQYIGWQGQRRIHSSLLHVDIKNGKIWIQHDGTPTGITEELLEAGVSPKEIVLAFHPPSERHLTPFAVA